MPEIKSRFDELTRILAEIERPSRLRRVAAHVAAAALALGIGTAVPGCDRRAVPSPSDGAMAPDLWRHEAFMPGLCRPDVGRDLFRPTPDLQPPDKLEPKPELCYGGPPGSSCLVDADCCIGHCDPVLKACLPPGLC